ncbi:MAG: tetratricopeptide repeat protein [Candidatus Eisenbacteria bacterium]|uniref:Tetratricopeptide repeat protein n=1 Tax=Eiseniibacteriota bacterium TaxID=2212470 RepID=A0A9D6L5F2_UNCEI|nr:tetratricopeptide repeat protein [Candidatus Eisenbacteria bacterium]MBI3540177.1 tetratricopeptide repeat protein [Candidatus Eisenbacteria bacterium]
MSREAARSARRAKTGTAAGASRPGRTPDAAPVARAHAVAASAPPVFADAWALAPIAAAIALAARAWFAWIGEPFADDFDFLTHAGAGGGWLDGGGSRFYWRPVARQLYYRTLGGTMLAHPAWIAAFQAACLALAAWLLYRTLRHRGIGGAAAAFAACFPLLLEPARALVAWPTMFQDLGVLLFSALALHETARSRVVTAMAALLAALLCKEVAVVTAVLMPLLPGGARPGGARPRAIRDLAQRMAAPAVVVIAWAAVYLWVAKHADLQFARDAVRDPAVLAVSRAARFAWAARESWTDAFDLAVLKGGVAIAMAWAPAAIAIATLVVLAMNRVARSRLVGSRGWIVWGVAWFALTTATLADVYPDWRPYRTPFGAVGLGIALAALLDAVQPRLLAALVALRLAAFALAPAPPAAVPEFAGARYSLDYTQIVRLQRLVGETRAVLLARRSPPAPGLRAARHFFPPTALYAFDGDKSIRAWYGDSSAHWLTVDRATDPGAQPPPLIFEFQPPGRRQVTMIVPAALWHLERNSTLVTRQAWDSALVEARIAESLQTESGSFVFASLSAGKRALALGGLERNDEALATAREALTLWPHNDDARYVIVLDHLRKAQYAEAEASLDSMLRINPRDPMLRKLMADARRRRSPWSPPGR